MRHLFHFSFSLRTQKLGILQHYQISSLPFHFHNSPTRYQLKWMTYTLPCLLQNQIKLLIVLPRFKALLDWGQQLYTKNATGIVFIKRRNGYRTRENLVTWVTVNSYQYKAYLITIHWPLKGDQYFNAITSTFVTLYTNLLSTLGLLVQSNKGGARFPQYSERLQLKVLNQILSPQLMWFLLPKAIYC